MNRCFHKRRGDQGYVLLVLLLSATLLSIGLLTMIERIDFKIKRDREEELIHRGLEYSRAVRKYVKANGRYPTSLEQLEHSNNMRFLRKRYKDPITGKDFEVLHYGDLVSFNAITSAVPTLSTASPKPSALTRQSGAIAPPEGQPANEPGVTEGAPNENPPTQGLATDGQSDPAQPDQAASASGEADPATQPPAGEAEPSAPTEDTGGVAVIGVASYSKRKSIRVFNKKDHYNQWQFVYDPSTDSGIMTGPNQPLLKGAANTQPQPAQGSIQDSGTNRAQN
jgi:type II secretory pathway pseudopilin PulG